MSTTKSTPQKTRPPRHLSDESRVWFGRITSDFELEPHHLKLLQAAAECWDRACEARDILKRDGLVWTDRHGSLKPHPMCAVERDNKTLFARLVRELALDVSEPEAPRPPIMQGNSHSRRGGN
jgi:phage terminase small subunit